MPIFGNRDQRELYVIQCYICHPHLSQFLNDMPPNLGGVIRQGSLPHMD